MSLLYIFLKPIYQNYKKIAQKTLLQMLKFVLFYQP